MFGHPADEDGFDPGPGGDWERGPEEYPEGSLSEDHPVPPWPPEWGAVPDDPGPPPTDAQAPAEAPEDLLAPGPDPWADLQRARFHPLAEACQGHRYNPSPN